MKSTTQQQGAMKAGADFMAAMADPASWHRNMANAMSAALKQPVPNLANVDFSVGIPAAALEKLPFKIDPARVLELQTNYRRAVAKLWADMVEGKSIKPRSDRRFASEEWHGRHAYVADLYLITANFLTSLAESVEADQITKTKIQFATQQMLDAMAPSNYLATNPEAIKKMLDTDGESLKAGILNMLADLHKGRISMSDESAFEIGRNIAVTEGAVIFQTEVFQLIQYSPLTETVHKIPLLIVPPCINKYYILDLQPESSFVRYAVEQGHTVFLMSWRCPTQEQAHFAWDDYADGAIRAIEVVQKLTKEPKINILGFCIGGTIVSTALAVLAAKGEHPAVSLTLLTTFLDFSDTGVMSIFIDEEFIRNQERTIGGLTPEGQPGGPLGVLPGSQLSRTFSFLRPNDLVWNYVVNNYLKGEAPVPFDLLFWNADGTNLPGVFFSWYLRNTYLENNLKEPGKVTLCGEPVDFGAIDTPVYLYASREDHIVPWPSAYASTQLLKGEKRVVVGASGHIAGVVNPAKKNKRSHWVNEPEDGSFPEDPEVWLNEAKEVRGSWWNDWAAWLAGRAGEQVPPPAKLGNSRYKPIEPAPGSYVKARGI